MSTNWKKKCKKKHNLRLELLCGLCDFPNFEKLSVWAAQIPMYQHPAGSQMQFAADGTPILPPSDWTSEVLFLHNYSVCLPFIVFFWWFLNDGSGAWYFYFNFFRYGVPLVTFFLKKNSYRREFSNFWSHKIKNAVKWLKTLGALLGRI